MVLLKVDIHASLRMWRKPWKVVPLNVLDLSKNPWLGATRRPGLGRGAISSDRAECADQLT